jgi:hypothetical protein
MLQTNDKALSVMAVVTEMPTEFYEYKTPTLRRLLRWPKYFIIEYAAMVAHKSYVVKHIR